MLVRSLAYRTQPGGGAGEEVDDGAVDDDDGGGGGGADLGLRERMSRRRAVRCGAAGAPETSATTWRRLTGGRGVGGDGVTTRRVVVVERCEALLGGPGLPEAAERATAANVASSTAARAAT